MIKLVGGLLLAFCGVTLAVSVCRYERKRLSVLDLFISLLFYIKGQVDCFSLPLCDIMKKSEFSSYGDFGQMLESNRIYLDGESYRLLESFYSEFGSVYRDEQLRRCDYYILELDERRKLNFSDLPSRTKIGGVLCLCSVMGILILLW